MFEINYIASEGYLLIRTTRDYSAEDVEVFLRAAANYAKRYNCDKMLFDHRNCRFTASVMEIHNITKYLEQFGLDIKMRGAVVFDQDQDKYSFADTVSSNWSMGILHFFNNYDRAKKWLLDEW